MKCPSCGALNIAGEVECQSCHTSLANLESHALKKGMEKRILEGQVSDLKPQAAWSVSPFQTVKDAVDLMRTKKGGCVLVLEAGHIRGIFSEREFLFMERLAFENRPIAEVMRDEPVCLNPSDLVADAFHQMAISGHRHLPVKLGEGEYGIISARDLLRYLCC
jgi:signal-transduction protein with cAMP-binding, CBS, and nucleotidyltransferase domain